MLGFPIICSSQDKKNIFRNFNAISYNAETWTEMFVIFILSLCMLSYLDFFSCYFLQILNFTKPVKIAPQQSMAAFLVQFHPNQTQLHFSTVLSISTNASTFSIPIIVYNGLMKVSSWLKIVKHLPFF